MTKSSSAEQEALSRAHPAGAVPLYAKSDVCRRHAHPDRPRRGVQ